MERWELEDIILGMADIVYENRELRRKLKQAEEYEREYNELLARNLKHAEESNRLLLENIFNGVFVNGISAIEK